MRFVQSSDFHLRADAPERLDALRQVVELAAAEGADALLIPGDLFDTDESAATLRPAVRDLLESFPGRTVIVPGNHDPGVCPDAADCGRRTIVMQRRPYAEQTLHTGRESVRVVGVPYAPRATLGQLLAGLEVEDPLRTILLAHGTFGSLAFRTADEESENAYLPIVEDDLRDRFAYAALGHLHARPTFDGWEAHRAWGYAGSPVAVTRGEIGPRCAVVVDFEPGAGVRDARSVRLDTVYWERVAVAALPWEQSAQVIARLEQDLGAVSADADHRRGLRVQLTGWIDGDEAEFRAGAERRLALVADRHRCIEPELSVRTVSATIERHPELLGLLGRARRLAAARDAEEDAVRLAVGFLIEAAGGGAT